MGTMVITTKGLIPIEQLEVKDTPTIEGGFRKIITQWFLDGELVRQDAWASCLTPMDLNSEQEQIGG